MLIAYSVEHLNTAQCQEFSEEEIKAIIEEDEHRGVYRLENKNEIKRFDGVDYEELKIFCHHGHQKYQDLKSASNVVDDFNWWNIYQILINAYNIKENYNCKDIIKGQFLSLAGFWSATEMRLNIGSEYYNVYIANNVSMVQKMHKDHQATWFYSSLPWKAKTLKFSPFERTCAGVLTREEYSISLQIYRVNYWQVLMTIAGLMLFFYAPSLCRNVFFHYTTGVAAGVFLSLVLFSYLIQRKFNLGRWALATYSLSVYFLTSLWYNVKTYLIQNHVYVLGYLVASGAISFATCYRMGPVENPRTINLIQWTLQFFALLMIYLSSYHQVASLTIALGILLWSSIPDSLKTKAQVQYNNRLFKPKIRLLSEDEYLDQSRVETEKALISLRDYCQSPKCSPWKLTSRLDSPTRFSEFVQGSSHITQDEIMAYSQADFEDDDVILDENHSNHPELTDDDSSDDTDIFN